MTIDTLSAWHEIVATRNESALFELLAETVVFHSPVVHTPQSGRPVVFAYLRAALQVFGQPSFRYVREVVGNQDAVLEFTVDLDGVHVNGVDMLRWDERGRVVDFKVLLRPLKAVNLIHQQMSSRLARPG